MKLVTNIEELPFEFDGLFQFNHNNGDITTVHLSLVNCIAIIREVSKDVNKGPRALHHTELLADSICKIFDLPIEKLNLYFKNDARTYGITTTSNNAAFEDYFKIAFVKRDKSGFFNPIINHLKKDDFIALLSSDYYVREQ